MVEYKLIINESIYDLRDLVYEKILIFSDNDINQSECDYRKELNPVRYQGKLGTCFAHSAACMKEWQERRDYNFKGYFSPQFLYNNRDYWNNDIPDGIDPNEDYGMTGRDVMKILKKLGICKEEDYPYGFNERANEISQEILEKAKKNVISKYAKIITLDGLKHSLLKNGPCLITMPVYNYGKKMWRKENNSKLIGGHAMTVVGFKDNKFILRNSWGENWGDEGYTYYDFNDWGAHWEIWTTIDKKEDEININNNCCIIV